MKVKELQSYIDQFNVGKSQNERLRRSGNKKDLMKRVAEIFSINISVPVITSKPSLRTSHGHSRKEKRQAHGNLEWAYELGVKYEEEGSVIFPCYEYAGSDNLQESSMDDISEDESIDSSSDDEEEPRARAQVIDKAEHSTCKLKSSTILEDSPPAIAKVHSIKAAIKQWNEDGVNEMESKYKKTKIWKEIKTTVLRRKVNIRISYLFII